MTYLCRCKRYVIPITYVFKFKLQKYQNKTMQYPVVNPRNGQVDYHFNIPSDEALVRRCALLRSGQKEWWGKRKKESILEVQLIAASIDRWCKIATDFFAERIEKKSSIPFIDIQQDFAPYPLIGVISPWNFPLLLSLIDTIPALLAGSSAIVKPSEVTPRFIEPLMRSIEAVPELASVLYYTAGDGKTGAALLGKLDLVCFTGSVSTGKKIYQEAAQHFIPAFLELGGKDPALVFEGADLDQASSALLWASTSNCGHSCLSIERIYVEESIFEEFLEKIVAKTKALKLAYPNVDDGQIGPIIAKRQVPIIDEHLKDAIAKGAVVQTGSTQCELKEGGYWCSPTILTNVDHSMQVMTEETFGPILPIMSFKEKAKGIRLANDTKFGLSAAVFAKDWETAKAIGQQIEAGAISINDAGLTAIIHGGEKNAFKFSGVGSTRMGPAAIKRFMRQQAFLVKKQNIPSPWWHS